jgi:hypothetical protein
MTLDTALKAPERPCRECGTTLAAEPSGPGRPRAFCGYKCRRAWHSRREQAERERERAEEKTRLRREYESRFYGKRNRGQQ